MSGQLWVRPALYSAGAICWVFVASVAQFILPDSWRLDIPKDTLINLFTILASTMLTVATFSVSAIAAAYAGVASSATPRATRLVVSDGAVQNTLAAFLATFIFAIVSLTALSAMDFGASGRLVLYSGFVFLVGWVLISFLRWVDRVTRLGRLGDTLSRIGAEGRKVFCDSRLRLLGGCSQAESRRPEGGHALVFAQFGYVQHIDLAELQQLAVKLDGRIWLDIRPGKFAEKGRTWGVLETERRPDEEEQAALDAAISLGDDRDFTTDPRFVLIMLGEVAGRALSPAVNDPGTAIRVLALEVELMQLWAQTDQAAAEDDEVVYDRVSVPALEAVSLVQDAFTPIMRDGAKSLEVGIRLHKALRALQRMHHPALASAALACRDLAFEYSDHDMVADAHKKILRTVAHAPL